MKSIILNSIYVMALVVATPWLVWRSIRHGKNRRGWSQKLWGKIPKRENLQSGKQCIWLHAVSVGEVNLLATMLTRLEKQLPDWEFVISTSTETGFDLASRKYHQHQVIFCPLDFTWAVNRVLDRVQPSMVILAELEVWPNLVRMVSRRGIPLAIVNGRLSEKSFRGYQKLGYLMRRILPKIDWIAVQSPTYAKRFVQLGADPDSIQVTGNVKFDGAQTDRGNARTLELVEWAGYEDNDLLFLAGSTQPNEDLIAVEVWRQLHAKNPALKLMLVPRHPQNVGLIQSYLEKSGVEYTLRSQLETRRTKHGVLIVDTVGELGAWWGRADIAYVGGSMGSRGGQNMIEPAAYGIPVSFGPNTQNFKDITELLHESNAAVVVHDADQLKQFVEKSIEDREWAAHQGQRAQDVVMRQQGAADKTVTQLVLMLTRDSGQTDSGPIQAAA